MTPKFPEFSKLVNARFVIMTSGDAVFEANVTDEQIFATYLGAFPEGTNPLYKTATEHECSCCKHFIRRAGKVVTIRPDLSGLNTVWDEAAKCAPYPYNVVATALRDLVANASIANLYRVSHKEPQFGQEETHSLPKDSAKTVSFNHFYTGPIRNGIKCDGAISADTKKGDYRTAVEVVVRSFEQLKLDAVEIVQSLINANSLYKGAEFKRGVDAFGDALKKFKSLDDRKQHLFAWSMGNSPAACFKNSAIGTLVEDLSKSDDVEGAVRSYEAKVAPQNYKRPNTLVTPDMIKRAMKTIEELGLESALERRFARLSDISVNDVLWVDGKVKPMMKGGLGDMLMKHAVKASSAEADEKRAETINLSDFMKNVLPTATGMELLFQGNHLGNLVSLTAPVHPEVRKLFKWNNDFAWSYSGCVTDSIKERVKQAGGRVDGVKLRVSLSWFNYDDLDLHIHEPRGGGLRGVRGEICYLNKLGWTNGQLDVDMNAGSGRTREPVENIVWQNTMPNGEYKIIVHNYAQRERVDVGFVIEVENEGKLSHFSYRRPVKTGDRVHVATLHMKDGRVERVTEGDDNIEKKNVSVDKWGLKTEQYVKVNAVTLSPNYWGENAVGNKHTFFLLDGAKNDESARGIYNEFLDSRLEPHRKVFELIGEKTKCQPIDDQLSGVGFSSTKHESVIIKVSQGTKQRVFEVKTGA